LAWLAALPVLIGLGCLTSRQCRTYRDAETLWRATLDRNPTAWLAHSNLGDLLMARGRFDEGLAHYQKTVELRPNRMSGLVNLGRAFYQAGEFRRAKECYERALQCPGEEFENLPVRRSVLENNLGTARLMLGDRAGSIEHFRRAVADYPEYADAYSNLGMALSLSGRRSEAIEPLRKALRLNSGDVETRRFLDDLLTEDGPPAADR
jgi:tetratricopeptide (TPR) repeat protein